MTRSASSLVILSLAVMACGNDRVEAGADAAMADADSAAAAPAPVGQQVMLATMNNSGATAEASLATVGERTSVAVKLTGARANVTLREHIHSGRCQQPGPPVVTLDSLVTDSAGTATATTMIDIPLGTVANGQHYVQVHGRDGAPIACGDVAALGGM